MNPIYKPGFYFGLLTFIFNLVFICIKYPWAQKNLILMFASALIGGCIGGMLFGWMWNWLKNRQI